MFLTIVALNIHRPTSPSVRSVCVHVCPASEKTVISDRLPSAKAKLKPKPTCERVAADLSVVHGGNVQDGRGRGNESGDIAPVITSDLHPNHITHWTSLTTLVAYDKRRPRSPDSAHSMEQSPALPAQHGFLDILDVHRQVRGTCSRPGRPPTSRFHGPKRQFYVISLHSISVARLPGWLTPTCLLSRA